MLQTVEAMIDENGHVELTEKISLSGPRRALVTILDDSHLQENMPEGLHDAALLSEAALVEGWVGPEADEAWKHLADLPAIDEDQPRRSFSD